MKKYNYSLKDMSQVFKITINAVSKALKRYHINYVKIDPQLDNEPHWEKRVFTLIEAIKVFNGHKHQNSNEDHKFSYFFITAPPT